MHYQYSCRFVWISKHFFVQHVRKLDLYNIAEDNFYYVIISFPR